MGGKTGYNDDARYCLVIATKIDGHPYFMSFLGNEGKLTRFGDVARVADWVQSHKPKGVPGPVPAADSGPTAVASAPLPVGVAAPPVEPAMPPAPTAISVTPPPLTPASPPAPAVQ
jgi:D-alanyl-D-alanine carboxypeptidase